MEQVREELSSLELDDFDDKRSEKDKKSERKGSIFIDQLREKFIKKE